MEKETGLEDLPLDVLFLMLEDVDPKSLISLCRTNRHFSRLCKNEKRLWERSLLKDWGVSIDSVNRDLSIRDGRPSSIYKQIYSNRALCKKEITGKKEEFLRSLAVETFFKDKNDYPVFLYLKDKILNTVFRSDYFRGYFNRYIASINRLYGNQINSKKTLTFEEFQIFKRICLEGMRGLSLFQQAILSRMFTEVKELSIPFAVEWKDLCNYNIFM